MTDNKDKSYYEDLDAYYESKKISGELLDSLESGTAGNGENLKHYFTENRYAHSLKSTLTDESILDSEVERFNAARESMDRNKMRLIQEISSNERKRISKKRMFVRLSLSGVAAAILFLTFQVLVPKESITDDIKKSVAANKLMKPTLILGTGRQITLDESERVINTDSYSHLYDSTDTNLSRRKDNPELVSVDNVLLIPSKYTYKVVLADGSVVTMNAGGKLVYPSSFRDDKREIELDGEAYFDIVKGSKPFIVKINSVKITVYGTQFNVKSFKDGSVETVLVEGSVGLCFDGGKEFKIEPNQLAVISCSGDKFVYKVDVQNYLGWINNSFCYHNSHLKKVFEDVENWYGVEIDTNMITEDECIDLYIDRTSPIEKIFRIVGETTNYKIINEGGGKYRIDK